MNTSLYTYFRIGIICCFSLLTFVSKAQTTIDTSFRTQMNTVFANIDKSKVPNGILRDYTMEFTNLEYYNGTASLVDSTQVTPAVFWQVFYTLITGRIHSNALGFVAPDTLENRWFSYRQPGSITLAGQLFNYARFKDNAYPNFITISGNQLYDKYTGGVWQDPYQTEKLFLISPSVLSYSGLSFSVLLPTNCWLSNTSHAGLSINFNDGLGYRSISTGSPLTVSYGAGGAKQWIYRLAISGGGYLYAHSYVNIINDPLY